MHALKLAIGGAWIVFWIYWVVADGLVAHRDPDPVVGQAVVQCR